MLPASDVEERQGFRVTTPLRTLLDVARGDVSQEQLENATAEALERGLVRASKLASAVRSDPGARRLAHAVERKGA